MRRPQFVLLASCVPASVAYASLPVRSRSALEPHPNAPCDGKGTLCADAWWPASTNARPMLLVGMSLDVSAVREPVWSKIRELCERGVVADVDIVVASLDKPLPERSPGSLAPCNASFWLQNPRVADAAPTRLRRLAALRDQQRARLVGAMEPSRAPSAVAVLDLDAADLPGAVVALDRQLDAPPFPK